MTKTFLTNCPHCKSVFKLREEHLKVASGHVRCGNCHSLFLATDSLVPLETEVQKAQMADSVEQAEEQLMAQQMSHSQPDFEWAAEEQHSLSIEETPDKHHGVLFAILSFIGILILCALSFWYFYLWPNKQQLSQDPAWRPVLEASCSVLQCQIPPLQDLNEYQVSAVDVVQMPGGQQKVSLLLRNTADFAQPFPRIRVILSDIKGGQFTSPIYTPAQYLPELNHNSLIKVDQAVQIAFSFSSPSQVYSGYQVELL